MDTHRKAIERPRELRRRVSGGHTLEAHRRSRLEGLLGEPIEQLRSCVYKEEKEKHHHSSKEFNSPGWSSPPCPPLTAQLELCRGLDLFPVVAHDALVHALIFFLDTLDHKAGWFQVDLRNPQESEFNFAATLLLNT